MAYLSKKHSPELEPYAPSSTSFRSDYGRISPLQSAVSRNRHQLSDHLLLIKGTLHLLRERKEIDDRQLRIDLPQNAPDLLFQV